jgi:hypothetical protein
LRYLRGSTGEPLLEILDDGVARFVAEVEPER